MTPARTLPSEIRLTQDPETGVEVRRLTDGPGDSRQLGVTHPGWYDEGRRLLFISSRGSRPGLYSLHLESGEIQPLTAGEPGRPELHGTTLNPMRPEAYYWKGPDLLALDLDSGAERVLHRNEDDSSPAPASATSDGNEICWSDIDAARNLSRVRRMGVDKGRAETVYETESRIRCVDASPTHSRVLLFRLDAPPGSLVQRLWGLDHHAGISWKIRPQAPDEDLDMAYWLSDGARIGYQGSLAGKTYFGVIGADNSGRREVCLPGEVLPSHSLGDQLIVGTAPGDPRIYLCRKSKEGYEGPRVLCGHGGHSQDHEARPRFSPDGLEILFTSGEGGWDNICVARVPGFDSLPLKGGTNGL